jgi:hypothetical protein
MTSTTCSTVFNFLFDELLSSFYLDLIGFSLSFFFELFCNAGKDSTTLAPFLTSMSIISLLAFICLQS